MPELRLPSQPQNVTANWPVPNYTAWWRGHTHGCEQLAHSRNAAATRPGVEPATTLSYVFCGPACHKSNVIPVISPRHPFCFITSSPKTRENCTEISCWLTGGDNGLKAAVIVVREVWLENDHHLVWFAGHCSRRSLVTTESTATTSAVHRSQCHLYSI